MNKLSSRNIALALLLIAALIVVLIARNRTPFGRDDTAFAVTPKKEITKIELSGKDRKVVLEKAGNTWLMDGKTEVRQTAAGFIERILRDVKIKSPVSAEMFNEEVVRKNIEPVRVRVFEKNRLLSSFLVFKTGSNIYGNIMRVSERSRPFIVFLPGYDGDIGSGFTLNEMFWMPFTVFNFMPSEISSVKLDNIADTASSFLITGSKSIYSLSDGEKELHGWDSSRVKRYISYFALVPFESWAFDLSESERNKISAMPPLFRITVKKSDSRLITLTLWEKTDNSTGNRDSDRLWGMTGDRPDLFIIRYFDIDPILKKRSYFFNR